MNPVLFVFSGLPGSGKSTLAKAIVVRTKSIYLRVDTIEQGIRDLCNYNVQGEGYRLSYRIAKENLIIGNSVVSDSCNPWELTRNEWKNLAIESNVKYINIEVMCSDKIEHKRRVETRKCEIEGLKLPTWEEIENRKYEKWNDEHIEIDTSNKTVSESIDELVNVLKMQEIIFID